MLHLAGCLMHVFVPCSQQAEKCGPSGVHAACWSTCKIHHVLYTFLLRESSTAYLQELTESVEHYILDSSMQTDLLTERPCQGDVLKGCM